MGWQHKTSFEQLVTEMVDADLAALKQNHGETGAMMYA